MEWNPRMSLQSRRLLQQHIDALAADLAVGWRGDATRAEPDLVVMLDHLGIGFVGLNPQSDRASQFVLHRALGGCERVEHLQPPLAFLDSQGVAVCALPVWPSLLALAVADGLSIEIRDQPAGPAPVVRWVPTHEPDDG